MTSSLRDTFVACLNETGVSKDNIPVKVTKTTITFVKCIRKSNKYVNCKIIYVKHNITK